MSLRKLPRGRGNQGEGARRPGGQARSYSGYGLRLRSRWRLPFPRASGSGPADVELFEAPRRLLLEAARQTARRPAGADWFQHHRLPDGSDYLRWAGLFEFVVSMDGRRIACHPLNGTSREAFSTYLLGQVLSFALLRQGIEPLHSTAVVIGGEAVGFLGDCGSGKSSLGAAFLQAGYPLLTDDLLVVREEGHGFLAHPGPPRIKLFPSVARRLLGEQILGVPMNPLTPKLVIPLGRDGTRVRRKAARLRALYVLAPLARESRSSRVTIRPLSPRQAFVELLRSTFNTILVDPPRLRRQFELVARLASQIPVKSLSFPRRLACLPAVRAAILSDVIA